MALCEVRTHDNILILTLPLSVDHVVSMTLKTEIQGYIAQKPKSILCDMSQTRYVSSSGLRVFLLIAKEAKVAGIHFGLFAITPFVDHVFGVSGFKALLAFYDSEDAAVRAAMRW
ncbi:STAS domain-containing protein [Methanoregula sp.]|uniref:STAS domain-containing protein n=1 Tax=Methanoregula sp. TaxID=2052170 RepID=UPI003563E7CC